MPLVLICSGVSAIWPFVSSCSPSCSCARPTSAWGAGIAGLSASPQADSQSGTINNNNFSFGFMGFSLEVGASSGSGQRGIGQALDLSAQDVGVARSEEHTSELQSLMRISYAV